MHPPLCIQRIEELLKCCLCTAIKLVSHVKQRMNHRNLSFQANRVTFLLPARVHERARVAPCNDTLRASVVLRAHVPIGITVVRDRRAHLHMRRGTTRHYNRRSSPVPPDKLAEPHWVQDTLEQLAEHEVVPLERLLAAALVKRDERRQHSQHEQHNSARHDALPNASANAVVDQAGVARVHAEGNVE